MGVRWVCSPQGASATTLNWQLKQINVSYLVHLVQLGCRKVCNICGDREFGKYMYIAVELTHVFGQYRMSTWKRRFLSIYTFFVSKQSYTIGQQVLEEKRMITHH